MANLSIKELTIAYHVGHDFGGWPRSVDNGSHNELRRLY